MWAWAAAETSLLTLVEQLDPARFVPHLLIPHDGQLAERWRAHGWPVHMRPFRGASVYFIPALYAQFPNSASHRTPDPRTEHSRARRAQRLSQPALYAARRPRRRCAAGVDVLGLVVSPEGVAAWLLRAAGSHLRRLVGDQEEISAIRPFSRPIRSKCCRRAWTRSASGRDATVPTCAPMRAYARTRRSSP